MSKYRKTGPTSEELIYGHDESIKLHESEKFFVKGQNRVVLNKFPPGVQSIEILDERAKPMYISSKVFTFNPHSKNIVLVNGTFEFVFDPKERKFVERVPQITRIDI